MNRLGTFMLTTGWWLVFAAALAGVFWLMTRGGGSR